MKAKTAPTCKRLHNHVKRGFWHFRASKSKNLLIPPDSALAHLAKTPQFPDNVYTMASIKDVAREAGVSIATVSRMMANKGYVKDDTRLRVEQAIKALDYRPNRVAQSLRERRSRIIGLIVSDIQNPFFGEICREVETFAHARGLSVFICNTDENPDKERDYLDLMIQERVAGVILSPTRKASRALTMLEEAHIPVVTVDRQCGKRSDAVLIDNEDAARRLTTRMIASGYTRIAGLFGIHSFTASERRAGFEAALTEQGLQPHAISQVPAFESDGEAAMEALLGALVAPDAVLCSSALLATGAFRAIHRAGLVIPHAFGFACFDDPAWATLVTPPVTVIRQPTAAIGEAAAELLLKRIENPTRPARVLRLAGDLVERKSLR